MSAPAVRQFTSPLITRTSIAWAAVATGSFAEIHFDDNFARAHQNLPSVIAPGPMICGWATQFLEDWAESGQLLDWEIRYKNPLLPDSRVVISGSVSEEWTTESGELHARCVATAVDDRDREVVAILGHACFPSLTGDGQS